MKTLLVINDGSPSARHAAALALNVAQSVNADLILANLVIEKSLAGQVMPVAAGGEPDMQEKAAKPHGLKDELTAISAEWAEECKPRISELDAADLSINDMVNFVNRNEIWMMVKGVDNDEAPQFYLSAHIQSVLNRVMCPLLLVPAKSALKNFERMVYMADLRYCQLPVAKYLAKLAGPFDASLQIAHVSAKGLPDMEENYAQHVFNDAVKAAVRYGRLFFNNIRERDLKKVADVLINSMRCDLLVLVNRQYHFEQLMGHDIVNALPDYLPVPVLVFPN